MPSPFLDAAIITILTVTSAMSFVNSDLIFELNAIVPLILLMVGWRRYLAAISIGQWPPVTVVPR